MSGQSALESRAAIVQRVRAVEMSNKNIKVPMKASKPEIGNHARKAQPR